MNERPAPPELKHDIQDVDVLSPECIEALRLIADSVAQQRQVAAQSVLQNPVMLTISVLVLALLLSSGRIDLSLLVTSGAGVIMIGLVAVRWIVNGYITQAEKINLDWVLSNRQATHQKPKIINCIFGSEVIGTLLLSQGSDTWEIRAWTVKLRYRGKGIGTSLLEETVKWAGKAGTSVKFADLHANSHRVLPRVLNTTLDRRDAQARALLEDLKTSR